MLLHHITLIVTNLAEAEAFYAEHFKLKRITVSGLDYPGAFFRLNDHQELHLAELPDKAPSFRGHFCLRVRNFNELFHRFRGLRILDTGPWGKLRELPNGSIQMYVRDPSGNLVEITSGAEDRSGIDPAVFEAQEWGGQPYRFTDGEDA